jgi:hypothetical protein
MKKNLALASLILIGSSLSAMDTEYFIGADISSSNINTKVGFTGTVTIDGVSYSDASVSVDDRDTTVGLKIGALLNKQHRISANYAKYSPSFDGITLDLKTYAVNYDYMLNKINKFTPFIGAHIGICDAETLGYSDTSGMYGIQGGTTYNITNNLEFEIGLSYSILTAEPKTPTVTGTYGSVTLTNASAYLETENMIKTYIGLNYKF